MVAGHHGVPAIGQGGGQRAGRSTVVVQGAHQDEGRHPYPSERLARSIDESTKNLDQRRWIAADRLQESLRHPFRRATLEGAEVGKDASEIIAAAAGVED